MAGPAAPAIAHAREVVGLEDLLDAPGGDLVALAGLAVARHDHAVAVAEGEHRGAVGHAPARSPRRAPRSRGLGSRSGDVRRRRSGEARCRVVDERAPASGSSRHAQQSPLRLAEVPQQVAGGRRVGEELAHVGLGAAERLQHEDLLQRALLEVEDHRVPGRRDDLVRVLLQAHAAEVGAGVLGRIVDGLGDLVVGRRSARPRRTPRACSRGPCPAGCRGTAGRSWPRASPPSRARAWPM